MKNQTYRMTMLFDFYGETLTDRQKEFFDLYYNEDLSLGEIAENYGISRQGVRDGIKRGEQILLKMEDTLQFAARLCALRENYTALSESIRAIASQTADSASVQEECRRALETVQQGEKLL